MKAFAPRKINTPTLISPVGGTRQCQALRGSRRDRLAQREKEEAHTPRGSSGGRQVLYGSTNARAHGKVKRKKNTH